MVWAHTHRVFSTFTYLGVPSDWIADRFRRPDFGICYELFGQPSEYLRDVAHPKRVSQEGFILTGLAYAAGSKGTDWWSEVIRQPLLDLVHPLVDGEPRVNGILLRETSLAGNLLGSFLAGDISYIPCSVFQDQLSDVLLPSNVRKLGAEALQAANSGDSTLGWTAIYRVFGDLPGVDGECDLMESAILKVNLAPLADNLVVCETVLHAASMQAGALGCVPAMEHLADEAAKMALIIRDRSRDGRNLSREERQLLASLFHVAINLQSRGDVGVTRTSDYVRLFEKIADAFPRSAGICRHFLNRIWPCEASQSKLLWPLLIRSRSVNI
jgi:hypothetical protein